MSQGRYTGWKSVQLSRRERRMIPGNARNSGLRAPGLGVSHVGFCFGHIIASAASIMIPR